MKTRHSTSANAWHKPGFSGARRLPVLAIILLPCLCLAAVPFPLIQQVSPPVVAPGATVPLTIIGANFDKTNSVVHASAGTVSATTWVSNSKLTVSYTAPNPGEAVFITVQNNNKTSNAMPLPITNLANVVFGDTSICFGIWSANSTPPCTNPTGVRSIAVGDFTNHGKLDIAVVNSTANNVSILLSNGDGTFGNLLAGPPYGASTLATYAVGHNPQAVAVGDFDHDGNLDLAVVNENDNTVSILMGHGDGTFGSQSVLTLPSTGAGTIALALADFNSDGKLDLAVLDQTDSTCPNSGSDGAVYVYTGNAASPPVFAQVATSCVGILPTSMITADFDTDGKPDLLVVNEGGGNATCPPGNGTVAFLNNSTVQGGGGGSSYCAGPGPSAAVEGDFNNDNVPDLVVTNATGAQISFLAGSNSSGFHFLTPASFAAGGLVPNSIVAGDFNGDGKLDVAVADQGNSELSILQGDGAGNFAPANGSPYVTNTTYGGRGPLSLVAADFNGDGKLDVATADNSDSFVTIMLQSPPVQFSPLSLDFSVVPEGATSPEQPLTITNMGSTTANISSLTISSPFQFDTGGETTCSLTGPFTLAPSASCVVGVKFAPTSIGPAAGTVTLQTSTGVAVSASLTGTGAATILNFSPSTVTFGATLLGTSATPVNVIVNNVGDYAATITNISITQTGSEFDVDHSSSCLTAGSLAAGSGTCQIIVTFKPAVLAGTGLRTASMTITYNFGFGNLTTTVPLSGDGTAPNTFFTPTPLVFANTPVGTQSAASAVYLLNDGTAPLTISNTGGITITGTNPSDFTIQTSPIPCPVSPATLAVSATCQVNITFTPSAEGPRTALLQFTDNNGAVDGSMQTVGLSGNGGGPLVSISGAPVMFGSQQVGSTSGPAFVYLSNLGTGPLTITSFAPLGGTNPGDFQLTNSLPPNNCPLSPAQLAQFGSCSVMITFTPTAGPVGTRSATLTFADNATPGTQTVNISGTATAGTASISTGSVVFGAVPITTTVGPMSFMISNTGTAPLAVSSIQINSTDLSPGEFTETDNCVGTISIGGNCTVMVKFTPSAVGLRTANLVITDNSGVCASCSTTQTVNLSGTGTDFSISVSPGSLTVSPGKVALFTLTLTPLSGFSGSVTLGCTITPTVVGTTCTVPAGTVTISGGAQNHIGVSAKPKKAKNPYTLTFSATYTATPPAVGTITRTTTAQLISK